MVGASRWEGPAQRLGTVLGLTLFTLLLGVLFQNPGFFALAEALATLTGLSYAFCHLAISWLGVEREPLERVFEEDEVRVRLRLKNRGWLPVHMIEVQDRFTAGAIILRKALIERIPAQGQAVVELDNRCVRGRGTFKLGPVELAVSDPLGLFRVSRQHACEGELVVYPRPLPLHHLDLESKLRGFLYSDQEIPQAGHSTNFFCLREYRPGEPARRIHWRASARRDRLLIADYEAPTHSDLTIFLDLDRRVLAGLGKGSNVEVAIRVTAALAKYGLDQGRAVQLVADGGQPTVLPPRVGDRQLIAVLHCLAHLRPKGEVPYVELLEQATSVVPDGRTVVLIFSQAHTETSERLVALWSDWRQRGIRLLAFVLDDRAFLRRESWSPPPPTSEALEGLLQRLGCDYIAIRGPQALDEVVA